MIRRVVALIGVPVIVALVVALPLGLWRGPHHWLCATVAVGLTVLPGLATLVLAQQFVKWPLGPVAVVFVGAFVRLGVGFGGAVGVFLASRPIFHADPWSYWLWVLGVYLVTLVLETVLLSKQVRQRPA